MSVASTHLMIFDLLGASYRTHDLTSTAAALAQIPLYIRGGDGVQSLVYGFGVDAPVVSLLPAALATIAQVVPSTITAGIYRPFMLAVQQELSQMGFLSIDAYLSAQNALLPLSYLVSSNFAAICYLFGGQQGAFLLSASNVFAPVTLFGSAVIAPNLPVVYTNQAAIPAANVPSNVIGASSQGYSAAPGLFAAVTMAINGTQTITVTANGQDKNGNAVAGRTWMAVLDNLPAGSAPVPLVPAVAGDRLYQVVNVTGAGTATAGAFTLTSAFERAINAGSPPAQTSGNLRPIFGEMPTGNMDGVNRVFTALHSPVGGMQVQLNGNNQDSVPVSQGGLGQVVVSGAQVTFAAAPGPTDYVRLNYFTSN